MPDTAYKTLVKKYFLWTAGLCALLCAAFMAAAWALDPLQLFHRARVADGPLDSDMRVQAAGILNSFDIDSIILGTSMLENTSAAEASEKLGGKFFNISLPGGTHSERARILKKALQKNLKNVVYSLDHYYLPNPKADIHTPAYLYDNNPFNDFRHYATRDGIQKLFQPGKGLTRKDHDRPNAWFEQTRDRFGGVGQWVAHRKNPQVRDTLFRDLPQLAATFASDTRKEEHDPELEEKARRYLEKTLLDIVKDHPDTQFHFIFPPYSRLRYAQQRRKAPKTFFLHQEMIRFFVERTRDSKNIHVYGFEDQDFPDDLGNYKDTGHYHQKFNSLFLDAIARGKHELTPENVEDYLKRCEEKAWDYDIPALNDEVQKLIRAAEAREKG